MKRKDKKAALYLRSSKDRNDVSIDAQRRLLTELAKEKNILIVHEYADPVVSAKDERRPEFQKLLVDLRSPTRTWNTLILLDTSRLSRKQYVAPVFKYELTRRNVEIVFAKVPDVDPISKVILENVLEAMDVVHSMMSKEKGLAGMAENVNQGFRAGGRAPRGYKLKHTATGAIREGKSIEKSTLEPNEQAPAVKRYLKARAQGHARRTAKSQSGILCGPGSLVDLEWNALTYAGHTVWNVRNEFSAGEGYKNGSKRKPREMWLIKKNTHKALIEDIEAEIIIKHLETSTHAQAIARAKTSISHHLLTGLLKSPDGQPWEGSGKHYRLRSKNGVKGRYVLKSDIENAVLNQLKIDVKSDDFVNSMLGIVSNHNNIQPPAELHQTQQLLNEVNKRISKTMDLAAELDDPAPALRKVNELEVKRKALANEITEIEREHISQAQLAMVSENDIRTVLRTISEDLEQPRKEVIKPFVKCIELDSENLDARIHYRIPVVDRANMASPRVGNDYPTLSYIRKLLINKIA